VCKSRQRWRGRFEGEERESLFQRGQELHPSLITTTQYGQKLERPGASPFPYNHYTTIWPKIIYGLFRVIQHTFNFLKIGSEAKLIFFVFLIKSIK
jgi:hypothetical protein